MSSRHWPSRRIVWGSLLASLVIAGVLFGNSVGGDFVLDDKIVIVGNPLIERHVPNIGEILSSPYHAYYPRTGLYRPFTILSYAINYAVFGPSPASFHIVNIILHALVVWALFLFLCISGDVLAAAIAAGLFMVFPVHSEAVASIVGRAELLAALFFVLGLLAVHYKRSFWASALFLAALLSKEVTIAFIPVSIGYQLWIQRGSIREVVRTQMYMFFAFVVYGILRFHALGQYVLSNDASFVYNPIKTAPFLVGLRTSLKVFWVSVVKLLIPHGFSSDYSYNAIPLVTVLWHSPAALGGLVLIVALGVVVWHYRDRLLGFGGLLFLSSYVVVGNFILKIGTITADRLMYLPSIGAAITLGVLAALVYRRSGTLKYSVTIAGAIVLAGYGFLLIQRNQVWANERVLFENAYRVAPGSVINQTNKAYLLLQSKDYQGARLLIDQALRSAPEHAPALNVAGYVYDKLDDPITAEQLWKRAIEARSDYLGPYLGLGMLYYRHGYFISAERVLSDAIAIYPRRNELWYLGLTKIALQKNQDAIDLVETHFGPHPTFDEFVFLLGLAYAQQGNLDQAQVYLGFLKQSVFRTELSDFLTSGDPVTIPVIGL